eukprot:TRINITY_DN2082_c1_g1_i2.p1 TRINITY_DN2082_c1_g1~~TRINITY_DN2082_c1_g1_i2.p1  ORF type:complete len:419 (-),score=122.67 TRINITY_DN2082_c1_g1_i2:186-1442(-)
MMTQGSWRLPLLWGLTLLEWISPVRTDIEIRYGHSIKVIRSVESSFGRSVPFGGLLGRILPGEPLDGCSPLLPAPLRRPEEPHWFVLLERSSNCTFEDKVSAATDGNFSAAIIFNNKDDRTFHMGGEGLALVPSVLIGLHNGESLLRNFTFNISPNVTALICPDEPFDLNVYLLPFAIVIGICFLLMLGIVVFKCVQDHRRNQRHRLPKSALKNLPIIKFDKESSPYDTCCICLDDFLPGDKLRILPCDHAYHKSCIDPWLVKNRRICPQCRKKVFGSREERSLANGGEDSDHEETDDEASEWDSLLRNARSSLRNSGTFHAGGTYAAARADQLSSRSVAQSFRDRFNVFLRYRRLDGGLDEPLDDQVQEEAEEEDQSSRSGSRQSQEEGPSSLHVAIVHSVGGSGGGGESDETEPRV